MSFFFERLTVYQKALEWVRVVERMLRAQGQECSRALADELSRAALAIPLNIARGAGSWRLEEKRRFYLVSRSAIFQCVGVLKVLRDEGSLSAELFDEAYAQLETLSKLMTGMLSANSAREGASTRGLGARRALDTKLADSRGVGHPS